jgi:AraC-like DNA-binding protein
MNLLTEGLLQVSFGSREETRTSPRYRWDNARRGSDPFVIVQWTRSGEGIFELGGRAHRVAPGQAFIALIPDNSRYYYPTEGRVPWVFAWVNFYGELALHLWRSLRNQAGPVIPLRPAALRHFRRLIARASQRDWADPYEASGAAYAFYLETLRQVPRRRPTRPFQNAISYFHAHYHEGIRMKEVAAQAGMSREHFTRLFAREMGCGPAAFLRRIRVEAAARLLRTTELPVAEAAFRSGWASATKLDLFFRRRYGVSPREYRRGRPRSLRIK